MNTYNSLSKKKIIDTYFLEHRAKLIEIAAFLDRIDRSADDNKNEDFRLNAFIDGLKIIIDKKSNRAKRLLELFSDKTTKPIASAAHNKGVYGASAN